MSNQRLKQCACGQFFTVEKRYRRRALCRDCTYSSQGHKGGPLYNTWSANYRKLWPTFLDFYMEVGEFQPGMMLTGKTPGTRPAPGNVHWVKKARTLGPQTFETTTDYEEMLLDAEFKDLAKTAFRFKNHEPSAGIRILDELETEFTALKQGDTEAWQIQLEKMANDYSIQLQREADLEDAGKGRGSQTRVGREFRNKLAPILALQLEEYHKAALAARSGRHFSLVAPLLEKLDYLTIAHITVTTVLDHLGRGAAVVHPLSRTYNEIGSRIDHQCFLDEVKRVDPRAFDRIDRWILRSSTMGYSYKIRAAKGHTEHVYNFMGEADRIGVGDWAFHCFQSITRWFDTLKFWEGTGKGSKSTYYLSLSPEGLKWRDLLQAAADDRAYETWPMVHPPLEWELGEDGKPTARGGYLKAHPGNTCRLIRNNKGTVPSPKAVAALHKMQSQAFQINPFIYETCKGLLLRSEEIGRFRTYEKDSWDDIHKPTIDPAVWELGRWDENRHERKEWVRSKKILQIWHSNRKKAEKERMAPFRVLMVAARFKNVDRFYLPCFFDNRLRMYYMVDTLNPQGSDYQKALLQFADGNPVTPENREQVRRDLLITLANTWANKEDGIKTDKLSLDGRVEFSESFLRELEGVAKDPLTTASKALWTSASEPFQFLATVREYYEIFVWKTSKVARVANGRDATNSGSQILGAIIRDQKTCIYTNVVPTEAPMDLYGEVAKEAQALLRNYGWLEKELAKAKKRAEKRMKQKQEEGAVDYVIDVDSLTFNLDPSVVDRSVCKRASMCTAYGASWQSKNEYVSEELDDLGLDQKVSLCEKIIVTNAVIQGQAAAFPKMEAVNKWFKKLAKACLDQDLTHVRWTTPNGSQVVQEYRERKTKEVTTYAMGGATYWQPTAGNDGIRAKDRSRISIQTGWGGVMESKTQTALGANWTHSHDACIVQQTVGDWEQPFYAVHDCFYGPAGTMEEMCKKARVSFYQTISSDPFGELIRANGVDAEKPLEGDVRVQDCLFSDYMFS